MQHGRLMAVEGWTYSWKALYSIDPVTLQRTTLMNPAAHPTLKRGETIFGDARIPLWPSVRLGDALITSGGFVRPLYLLNRGNPVPAISGVFV